MTENTNSLGAAFVYVEVEKQKAVDRTLESIQSIIESLVLDKYRNNPEELTPQYIKDLKDISKILENMRVSKNKWQQDEREHLEVHNYLCNFTKESDLVTGENALTPQKDQTVVTF